MTPSPTTIPTQQVQLLLQSAQQAAKNAYNPYSHFSVGCGLLSKTGKVYCGCNIENASYSVTICAERVAASQAIYERDLDWLAMVIVSPLRVSACGVCRQFLHEFSPSLQIWCGYLDKDELIGPALLSDLLPGAMSLHGIRNSNAS
jgi:cytidine deaminase